MPAASDEVVSVAAPLNTATVPSEMAPSKNSMVPVARFGDPREAVNVTACSGAAGFRLETRFTVLGFFTSRLTGAELAA